MTLSDEQVKQIISIVEPNSTLKEAGNFYHKYNGEEVLYVFRTSKPIVIGNETWGETWKEYLIMDNLDIVGMPYGFTDGSSFMVRNMFKVVDLFKSWGLQPS